MPSDALTAVIAGLEANELTPDSPVEEWREAIDMIGELIPPAEGVTVEALPLDEVPVDGPGRDDGAGVPGEVLVPADRETGRAVLLLHGGGYAIGSPKSHRPLGSRLASRCRALVHTPDDRLAPEHPAPAALDDALAAWRWLLERDDVDPAAASLCGDSAGGGLALALAARLREEGLPQPAALVLWSPWVDLTGTASSLTANAATDPSLSPELLARWADWYLAGTDPRDPRVSPLFAEPAPLPRTLVFATDVETLADDATRLTRALVAAGNEVRLEVRERLFHDWVMYAGMVPEADDALDEAARFLHP